MLLTRTPGGAGATTVLSVSDQQAARAQAMQRAYNAYVGHPKKPLAVRGGEPDDNLLLCLGRLIVDKGVSFLWGQDVPTQVTDALPQTPGARATAPQARPTGRPTDDGPTPAHHLLKQDWLTECWRRQRREITLQKFATTGGICGHAFMRLLDTRPWPRLIVLDPQTVDVLTDPDDIDTVWRYTITPPPAAVADETHEPQQRRTIIQTEHGVAGRAVLRPAGRPATWSIIDQSFAGGVWQTVATQVWPYPFSPMIDCQNLPRPNDFWGESDLPDDVLHVLDGINRVASHYSKIIRLHAHPKIWSRGLGTRTLDVAIDTVINLPSETAELKSLEMQSDLGSTMALLEKLLNIISMMVRIPLVAMGLPDNLGAISGVALQIRYQPLIEKTELKRRTYGDAAIEMDRRLLALGGFGDTTITAPQWPNILPQDDLEERQVWVLDRSMDLVSRETLSEKAGYDFAHEQQRLQAEKEHDAQQAASDAALHAAATPAPAAPGTAGPASSAGGRPGAVPPPAPLGAPAPDTAKGRKSS